MKGEGSVSVVLPTYNERGTVLAAISGVQHTLSSYDVEVIVVDDGSPDGTADHVDARYGDVDWVRCIRRPDASGLASAVLRGFQAADGETLAVMDADLQHPPRELARLVVPVAGGETDVAVGSRHAAGGEVAADWPRWRRAVSRGASLLARLAVPQARTLSDPMSGFFAVRRDVVDAVAGQLDPCGYKILLEVLARCPVECVHEAGYTFEPREYGSSNLGAREYAAYVEHLLRLVVPSRQPSGRAAVGVREGVVDE